MKKKISKRLRLLRGLQTFDQAAEKAGIKGGHWHRLETGSNKPTFRTAQRIASGYDVDPEWILEGKGRGHQKHGVISDPWKAYGDRPHYYEVKRIDRNKIQILMPLSLFRTTIFDTLIDKSAMWRALDLIISRCAFDDEVVWRLVENQD